MKKQLTGWMDVVENCYAMANTLHQRLYTSETEEHKFQLIVPIAMGGLIPGALIGRQLERLGRVCMFSNTRYYKYKEGEPELGPEDILQHPNKFFPSQYELQLVSSCIIVDDVCETGETLMAARREVGVMFSAWGLDQKVAVHTATLWTTRGVDKYPDVTANVKNKGVFIVFPWEVEL